MNSDPLPPGWPESWRAALGDAALKDASSAAIFRRGQDYAASGAVEVIEEDPLPEPALRARVSGSETYATEVWIADDAIAGSCDCPNAEDGWFCKHQVAVALVWRERLLDPAAGADSDSPAKASTRPKSKRVLTELEQRQLLRDFLLDQPASALADKLLALADRDHDVHRELQQWQQASQTTGAVAELKPLVTDMLWPGRDFIAWGESYAYARRAEAVLPLLQQARTRDATAAADLCLHALRCAWKALEQADDSDGEIGDLCQDIGAEWVAALQVAGAQPAAFGDTYLQVQLDDPFGCFDTAAVEAAIGEPALGRFRQVLGARWRQAKDAVVALRAAHAAKVAARKGRVTTTPCSPSRPVENNS